MSCNNSDCGNLVYGTNTCLLCKSPRYCSPDCKRQDWFQCHQYLCPANNQKLSLTDFHFEHRSEILGKGTYGEVKLITHSVSNRKFALKEILKSDIKKEYHLNVILREIEIHKSLKHSHIVQLYTHFEDKNSLSMLLEYAEKGSLFDIIYQNRGLTESKAWKFFTETCMGIKYLHDQKIIHRDLKPENILIDRNENIKICDFGWCVQTNEERNTFCGTLDYMAPEMILNTGHSFAVDLWALGVLLYELIHGYPPFRAEKQEEKCKKILVNEVRFKSSVSVKARDLILKLVETEPSQRISLNEVLEHPWVDQFDHECLLKEGQKVVHPQYGQGVIKRLKGLICIVECGKKTLYFSQPDVPWEMELISIKTSDEGLFFLKSDFLSLKEKKVFNKIENWKVKRVKKNKERILKNMKSETALELGEILKKYASLRGFSKQKEKFESRIIVPDKDNEAGGLLKDTEFNSFLKGANSLIVEKGSLKREKEKVWLEKEISSHKFFIDISDNKLVEREKELEKLTGCIQRKSNRLSLNSPINKKYPTEKRRQQSFFARVFGCGDR